MNARELPYVTRLLVPEKRADTLHRERLVDFLHEQVECRLILVSAPAGYGKTTLLTDFAHGVSAAVCWYSLSASDKDPKVFLEYFIASIRKRFPGFGEKTLSLLDKVTNLSKELSSMVGILVNEMHEAIPEYFFVVLDDYHHVDDSPTVNEALDLLLYYLPSNCHIIVSSRTLPRLTLSRLAAQRLVSGLGTSDLRFTVKEIREFLRVSFRVLLPDSMAQQLADSSEGWITGIVLSAYGLGQGMLETIIRARNSGGPVFDFLANEVFKQQPSDVQRFLLESSVFPQFNSQRCSKVMGIDNVHEILKAVEERNLFITRTEGGDWYRYHNLFAEFLQSKLKVDFPGRYVELNLRAGSVCREVGELDDAVQHFACAERHDYVIEIIEAAAEELLNVGKLRTVQRWIEVIPSDTLEASPTLMAFQGRVLYQVSELDKAAEAFNRAIEGFERCGDSRNAARTLIRRSTVLRLKGLRQEAIDDCLRVIESAKDDEELEAEARKVIGVARGMEGKFGESIPELKRALAIYERLGSVYQIAELNDALGAASYSKGDLSTAFQYFRRSLGHWEKLGNHGLAASILNNLAMISYWQGEYEEALETLREALTRVREGGYLRIEAGILGSMGTVLRDMDKFDEALRAYETALDLARRADEVLLITDLLNDIGGIYRLCGDMARAERLVRQALFQAIEYRARKEAALYELTLGLIARDRGDLRQAASHLKKSCKGLKAGGAQRELARAHYHLASVLLTSGERGDAEKQIRVINEIISALGYETFLFADIRRVPQPIEFAASRGLDFGWIERLSRQIKPSEKPPTPPMPVRQSVVEGPREDLLPVRVTALGAERVICGSREITESDWSTQVTKELFFYLVSQPRGARREEILEGLWPELSTARASSNFHGTLYRLRRATYPDLIVHQGGRYFLNPSVEIWYDVEEFERSVAKALSSGTNSDEGMLCWEKAVKLYQGPFLPQFYSEWCESKRRSVEERCLQARGSLARHHFRKGDFSASISYYEGILEVDPYAEEVHRQLIKAYDMAGDRPAAIRQYNRLVQMLREELGSDPSSETVAVYNSLLRGSTGSKANSDGKDDKSAAAKKRNQRE